MSRIIRTPQAQEDILSVWEYIAGDNVTAADKLVRSIDEKLALLATQPLMGSPMDEYRPGLRASFVGNYIIFYHPLEDGIEVYRVLHGAQQFEDLL